MSIDPAFASYLAIALRLTPAGARRDLAGWTITPAPPPPPDMGR